MIYDFIKTYFKYFKLSAISPLLLIIVAGILYIISNKWNNERILLFLNKLKFKIVSSRLKNNKELTLAIVDLYWLIIYLMKKKSKIDVNGNELIIEDNIKFPLNRLRDYAQALNAGWTFDGNYWSYNGVKFRDITYTAVEVFNGDYDIDVSGKEIVDVGASIGDSSIYFALKGARKVIAIEPLPSVYEELVYNVKLNHLEDKIVTINAGLSDKPGKIKVPAKMDLHDTPAYSLRNEGEAEIPLITMSDILKLLNEPYLLKMDCEGCEDIVIRNDYENVKKFKVLVFEYQFPKKRKEIKKILEKDYICKIREGVYADMFYCYKKEAH